MAVVFMFIVCGHLYDVCELYTVGMVSQLCGLLMVCDCIFLPQVGAMLHGSVVDGVFRLILRYASWLGVYFHMLCRYCCFKSTK